MYDVVSPTEIRDDLGGTVYSNLISLNDHVIDEENPHNVTKAQLGLGNVDNTSDSAKPVSTAQQAALDEKVDKSVTASGGMGVSGIVNSGSSMEFSVKNNSSDTDATRLYLTKMQVTLDVSGVQALSAMAKSGVVTLNGPGGNILDESMVLTDTDIEDICV